VKWHSVAEIFEQSEATTLPEQESVQVQPRWSRHSKSKSSPLQEEALPRQAPSGDDHVHPTCCVQLKTSLSEPQSDAAPEQVLVS
jgi:hypothetical protein